MSKGTPSRWVVSRRLEFRRLITLELSARVLSLKVSQVPARGPECLAEPEGFYLSITYQSESIQEMETAWYVKQGKLNIKVLNC